MLVLDGAVTAAGPPSEALRPEVLAAAFRGRMMVIDTRSRCGARRRSRARPRRTRQGDVNSSELHQQVADRLAAQEQRYTRRRRAIVEVLLSGAAPFTLPELLAADPSLSQSSTYRNLAALVDVRRRPPSRARRRRPRQLRTGGGPHRAPSPSHLLDVRHGHRRHARRSPRIRARSGVRRRGEGQRIPPPAPLDRHLRLLLELQLTPDRVLASISVVLTPRSDARSAVSHPVATIRA